MSSLEDVFAQLFALLIPLFSLALVTLFIPFDAKSVERHASFCTQSARDASLDSPQFWYDIEQLQPTIDTAGHS